MDKEDKKINNVSNPEYKITEYILSFDKLGNIINIHKVEED